MLPSTVMAPRAKVVVLLNRVSLESIERQWILIHGRTSDTPSCLTRVILLRRITTCATGERSEPSRFRQAPSAAIVVRPHVRVRRDTVDAVLPRFGQSRVPSDVLGLGPGPVFLEDRDAVFGGELTANQAGSLVASYRSQR